MSDLRPDAPPSAIVPRRRTARRLGIAVLLLLLVGLIGLWIDRKPIATGYIGRTLTNAHVPARYALAELAPGHQRLTDVVIGDPLHPDLVADWIETRTRIGLSGVRLTGVRAGHVRLHGRLVDGRLSLGAIDRLLPPSAGAPFALPAIDLSVTDGRMRLETPAGPIGVALTGQGRLDDGFRGTIAAVSDRMADGGCAASGPSVVLRMAVTARAPHLSGPVRLREIACKGVRIAQAAADIDATLSPDLRHWRGQATIATGQVRGQGYVAQAAAGAVSFDGEGRTTQGRLSLDLHAPRMAMGEAASIGMAGAYRTGRTSAFVGTLRADRAALALPLRARADTLSRGVAGTPLGPLAAAAARAVSAAAADISGQAAVALAWSDGRAALRIGSARLASASGARLALAGGAGIRVGWPSGVRAIDTDVVLNGGGLPAVRASLRQTSPAAAMRGTATMQPYAAAGARMALTPVRFDASVGGTTIATRATLSGPLADGRVEALSLPIAGWWDGRSRLVVGARCTPMGFDRLALAGLVLGRTRTVLCPVDGALLRMDGGRLGGGGALETMRLQGTLGGNPLALGMDQAVLRLADRGFGLTGVHVALGPVGRRTRLDVAHLQGIATGRIGGSFTGGAGQIADVPLLLSGAQGEWRFADGMLSVTGALGVADAGTPARFKPLAARDVALTLTNGRIDAHGTLHEPTTGATVANVAIRHDLALGSGTADMTVPALAFDKALQPDLLTPLTYGVIADVRGTVTGAAHIGWTGAGVTSTGRFRTGDLDLAAAFGPVTGLAGEIVFTDLLALQSAPGQVATVRSINPGIVVTDGRIVYGILPGARIRIEGARWPFAGGALTLDPGVLDFSAPAERRLTFRVDGAAADQFLQQFDFKNLDASGVFDGVLPMIFDATGGRIEQGLLRVREGGGGIAYVGDLTQKDLGFWGNLAFQALKSLRYRSLSVTMNGPLDGEMVTAVRFAGVSQGAGAKSNFLIRRLQRLPFVFNVTIRAPFRGLLDSAASFYEPKRLIERNLPALLQEQDKQAAPPAAIQPSASRTMP